MVQLNPSGNILHIQCYQHYNSSLQKFLKLMLRKILPLYVHIDISDILVLSFSVQSLIIIISIPPSLLTHYYVKSFISISTTTMGTLDTLDTLDTRTMDTLLCYCQISPAQATHDTLCTKPARGGDTWYLSQANLEINLVPNCLSIYEQTLTIYKLYVIIYSQK